MSRLVLTIYPGDGQLVDIDGPATIELVPRTGKSANEVSMIIVAPKTTNVRRSDMRKPEPGNEVD